MAVEAVASVVIQKVTDLLIQDAIIFYNIIDQVEDIRIELRKLRGFLTDVDARWVREYLDIVYKVEDVVESYVLSLARKKRGMGFFQNYGFFFHDWIACRKLREKMRQIEKKIQLLKQMKVHKNEDPSLKWICPVPGPTLMENQLKLNHSYDEEKDSDFIGFKEHMEQLMCQLLNENSSSIIPVVGLPGSGKTTLVRRAYNHKCIRGQFKCRFWIDSSEENFVKDLMHKIQNQVNKKQHYDRQLTVSLDEVQPEKRLSELLELLDKYLIILDYANDPNVWKQLMTALPEVGKGSKVVLIIRKNDDDNNNMEHLKRCSQPLSLKSLDESKSWELFKSKLNRQDSEALNSHDEWACKFAEKILQKCKGIPQKIELLGGLLCTKKLSHDEWARLFNHPNWSNSEIWSLSYNDLPPQYKLCLLYLGLFPKEYNVPVRRILRLWLAEGFLSQSTRLSEDLAEDCLKYLIKRNFIKVTKFRSDGEPKVCLLPAYLREHLIPMAKDLSLFHIHNTTAQSSRTCDHSEVRRIVEYADIRDFATGSENLRSYLSFNLPRHDAPAKQVGNFLCKMIGNKGFGLLRILDLERVYKPTLPQTLKNLLQLRYLGLRWTYLDILPESVGDLPYLETLDLKRTYINHIPSSIWRLQHLRHLNLPQIQIDMGKLLPSSQLLTLWGLVIDDVQKIQGQSKLRELGITCRALPSYDNLMDWIAKLTDLQSLSLTSINDMSRPYDLTLKLSENNSRPSCIGLECLHHLKLLGRLRQPLEKEHFPPNLRVLALSVSYLTQDPMEILSQLPHLAVLRLLADSYIGQKMQCPKSGFLCLSSLKLWMLKELEEWTVHEGGMPKIRKLSIRKCHKLKKIPIELLSRLTLEELVVENMSSEFVDNSNKNKSKSTILTVNTYDFSPLPWEKDADLWN